MGFGVACSAGFASCKTFGKQPKHPWFGRSPNAGCQSLVSLRRAATVCDWLQASLLGEGGSPTLSPFPGKGVFGKDAEIRTHQALHEAKPTECPKGDRDWGQALFLKNILFLQTELFIFLFFGFIKQNTTVSAYLLFLTISFLCCKIYVECGSNRFPLFSRWQRDRFSMQARQMILSGMNNGFILSKL